MNKSIVSIIIIIDTYITCKYLIFKVCNFDDKIHSKLIKISYAWNYFVEIHH